MVDQEPRFSVEGGFLRFLRSWVSTPRVLAVEGDGYCDLVRFQGGGRIGHGAEIGCGSLLKWGATITHNAVVGQNVFLGPYSTLLGPDGFEYSFAGAIATFRNNRTVISAHCSIGAYSSIACGVTLGEHVQIGAHSHVTRDIVEPGTYVGIANRLRRIR